MSETLIDFIKTHAEIVPPGAGGTDVHFFAVKVAPEKVDMERLKYLILNHKGVHCDLSPLDGKEHGYIEIGAWLDSQGMALRLMGMGASLGLWKLRTPKGMGCPPGLADQMAGLGMITVQA